MVYINSENMFDNLWKASASNDKIIELIAQNFITGVIGAILLLLLTLLVCGIIGLIALAVRIIPEAILGFIGLDCIGMMIGVVAGCTLFILTAIVTIGYTSGIIAAAFGETFGICYMILEGIVVFYELLLGTELIDVF